MPLIKDITLVQRMPDNHWAYRMTYNDDQVAYAKGGRDLVDAQRGMAQYLRSYTRTIERIGVSPFSSVSYHIRGIKVFIQVLEDDLEKELFSLDKASKLVLYCQHSIN